MERLNQVQVFRTPQKNSVTISFFQKNTVNKAGDETCLLNAESCVGTLDGIHVKQVILT